MSGSQRLRTARILATGVSLAALAIVPTAVASAANAAQPAKQAATQFHYAADHMGMGAALASGSAAPRSLSPAAVPSGPKGLDVSSYQGNVNWATVKANGGTFAYSKATEGTGYTNPYFSQQYTGSYNAGLLHAAYHFALPNNSTGAAQADYFVNHGGGWSQDGKTLPGALDIEYNPYGATCYGLSQSSMRTWISSFVNEYHARTTRWAVIYTTTDWWTTCTGNYSGFWANDPAWIANYSGAVTPLPAGVPFWTFWQYADAGTFPGDQDVFNGTADRLVALANG